MGNVRFRAFLPRGIGGVISRDVLCPRIDRRAETSGPKVRIADTSARRARALFGRLDSFSPRIRLGGRATNEAGLRPDGSGRTRAPLSFLFDKKTLRSLMAKSGRSGSEQIFPNTLAGILLRGTNGKASLSKAYTDALLLLKGVQGLSASKILELERVIGLYDAKGEQKPPAEGLLKLRLAKKEDAYLLCSEENIIAAVRTDQAMVDRLLGVIANPPEGLPRPASLIEAAQYLGEDGLELLQIAEDGFENDTLKNGLDRTYFRSHKQPTLSNVLGSKDASLFVRWITRMQIAEMEEAETVLHVKTAFPGRELLLKYWKVFHQGETPPRVLNLSNRDMAAWAILLSNQNLAGLRDGLMSLMEGVLDPGALMDFIKIGGIKGGRCSSITSAVTRAKKLYFNFVALKSSGRGGLFSVEEILAHGKGEIPKGIKYPLATEPIEPLEGGPSKPKKPEMNGESSGWEELKRSPIYQILSNYTQRFENVSLSAARNIIASVRRLMTAPSHELLKYLGSLGIPEDIVQEAFEGLKELPSLDARPAREVKNDRLRVEQTVLRPLTPVQRSMLAAYRNQVPTGAPKRDINIALERLSLAWMANRPDDALVAEVEKLIRNLRFAEKMGTEKPKSTR